jgi:hypothetical protein
MSAERSVDESLGVLGYQERLVAMEESGPYGFPGHMGAGARQERL